MNRLSALLLLPLFLSACGGTTDSADPQVYIAGKPWPKGEPVPALRMWHEPSAQQLAVWQAETDTQRAIDAAAAAASAAQ